MNYVEHLNLFGVAAKEISCIKGSGAPTTSTEGAVGLLYMDADNGDMYKCIAIANNTYTWENVNKQTTAKIYTFENLYNPATHTPGKYITPTTGKLSDNASYVTTDYIPVSPGDEIILTKKFNRAKLPQTIGMLCYFSDDKKVVTPAPATHKNEYIIPDGVKYIRASFSTSGDYDNKGKYSVEKRPDIGIQPEYLEYGDKREYIITDSIPDFYIPTTINIRTNATTDIYYNGMLGATNPCYYIDFVYAPTSNVASIKSQYDKLTITTTTTAGAISAMAFVYNSKNECVYSKRCSIQSRAASTETLILNPIGDSLTNTKIWEAELIRFNNNLSLVGSKSAYTKDSTGVDRLISHSGYSGWSTGTFTSKASYNAETNPFWDATLNDGAGGFSWAYYLQNTLNGVEPNYINFFLGMNDIDVSTDKVVGRIKNMIDNIIGTSPNVKILLCSPQYRDLKEASYINKAIFDLALAMHKTFSGYSNVRLVPLAIYHDSEHNYLSTSTSPANPYSTITQQSVLDATHPQQAGYLQIADVIFAHLY